MRQKILSLIIILVLILFTFFIFRGCSELLFKQMHESVGVRDWRVVLTNGFEIQKLNGNNIIMIKDGWSSNSNIVISRYINAYCYTDSYIGIWCAKDGASDLLGIDSEKDIFYLIDVQKNALVGQYTKDEYENYCLDQHILGLDEWVYTTPRPDEAIFN